MSLNLNFIDLICYPKDLMYFISYLAIDRARSLEPSESSTIAEALIINSEHFLMIYVFFSQV